MNNGEGRLWIDSIRPAQLIAGGLFYMPPCSLLSPAVEPLGEFFMPKLSFMKWYPADWINDTRELSPEAKGAWVDILCLMWNAHKRGQWQGTYQEFARATGLPWEIAPRVVDELARKTSRVTIRDNQVTIENRRMIKQEMIYKDHAKRQREYRMRQASDKKMIPKTLDSSILLKTLDVKTTSTSTPSAGAVNPFWKTLIGHVNDTWVAKKRGSKYPWTQKDFAALKRLSGVYEPWGVMALWDAYLRSDDTWAIEHGYDVVTFASQIPKLVDDPRWKQSANTYRDKLEPANPEMTKTLTGMMGAKQMPGVNA